MPVDDAPEDDQLRQTYNFAPGYHGLVYRADVPDYGAGPHRHDHASAGTADGESAPVPAEPAEETRYKLQAMKWGRCFFCVLLPIASLYLFSHGMFARSLGSL